MNQLQRLTNYNVADTESIMEIRTERLDPIVSSAYRYQFRLDTSSYIDRNTMLTFKCHTTAGASDNVRLNCFNGGLGAIRSVELQVGDFSIQKIENVNLWSTANHLYAKTPSVQNKKLSHYLHNALKYKVNPVAGAADCDVTGSIAPDNDKSGVNYGRSDTGAGAAINNMKLNQTASNNETIGIPLGMLLPMLNDRDLPLFLFTNYKVHLTIEFESASSAFANNITQNNYAANQRLAATDGEVLFSDVELVADYLILPSRVQNSVLEETAKEGGYVLDFLNVDNIKKTIDAGTANTTQEVEHRINLINQECHYLQMFKTLPNTMSDKVLLAQRSDGVSLEKIQFNVNGVDIYTAGKVGNPCELYNNVTYTLGTDLQVVAPLYKKDPNTIASLLAPPQQGLQGKYKPLMLSLQNGEPTRRGGGRFIGEYPIRVIYERTPSAAADTTWFAANNFSLVEAEQGTLKVDYFVGTTRIMNVKTMPNGSMNVLVSDL
jgi:hypothetical protein